MGDSKKTDSTSSNSFSVKKIALLGAIIIILIFIVSAGMDTLGMDSIEHGYEHIINIKDGGSNDSNGVYSYHVSFVLANASKEANTYFSLITFYDNNGNVVLTKAEDLAYGFIDNDNTVDVFITTSVDHPINIDKCTIEIIDSQGNVITASNYNWTKN